MIETVLITNGRSTFGFAMESLRQQTYRTQVMIVQGMRWIDAVNFGLNHVMKPYMLRVDDDMFLHPRALEFMVDTMPKDSVMHRGQLYEHYTKMVAGRVKIYNVEKTKKVGFRTNRLGKIDRCFEEDTQKKNMKITIADKNSPIGLHACAPWEEMLEYEKLWGHKKSRRGSMKVYDVPVERQFEKRIKIIERYNKQHGTRFWEWLNQ